MFKGQVIDDKNFKRKLMKRKLPEGVFSWIVILNENPFFMLSSALQFKTAFDRMVQRIKMFYEFTLVFFLSLDKCDL